MSMSIRGSRLDDWPTRWVVPTLLLLVAFALRLAVALRFPGIHHPDEIFQSLEQAHRVVFGPGLIPWEFRDGARSWLLPGLLIPPMWLGERLAPGTDAYRHCAVGVVALISATIPLLGWWWGRRHGRTHGIVAAAALLTWFELLHFGARAFSEVVAGACLFAAVFLCSDRTTLASSRRTALAGFLLGSTFVFRFHVAPAIVLSAAWLARRELRRGWLPMIAGGLVPLAVLGAVDWSTWSVPFHSIIENLRFNIVEGRSHLYGTSPWYAYLDEFQARWGVVGSLVLGGLALCGARRQPLPLLVALVVVAIHSTIAHKEYRFLYPAIPLLVLCAAIGSADLSRWLAGRSRTALAHLGLPLLAVAAWALGSYGLARSEPSRTEWLRGNAGIELLARAGRETTCGVALLGAEWYMSGGYSSLHRNVPLHLLYLDAPDDWDTEAFDVWIAPAGWLERTPVAAAVGFEPRECRVQRAQGFERLCYWSRHRGGCRRQPATEAQRVLEARGY